MTYSDPLQWLIIGVIIVLFLLFVVYLILRIFRTLNRVDRYLDGKERNPTTRIGGCKAYNETSPP